MGRKLLFLGLFSTLFIVIYNYTLTISAALYVASELGGSSYTTIYSLSFFAIGNALGVPLGRALSPKVGTARLLVTALLLFSLFSLFCGLAATYPLFILFRFLQGLVSGPFYTLVNRLFSGLTPENRKKHFTSITMTLFIMGPVIGAIWGGWVAYFHNWRYLFYLDIPLALGTALILHKELKGYEPPFRALGFDAVGYFFYFVGLLSLSTIFILGQELDWWRSPFLITLLIIGVPSFTFFIIWSLFHPTPVIDFRQLKRIELTFALCNLTILFSIYFGMLILLSLWLALYANYTPIWIGLLFGVMVITGLIPTFFIFYNLGKFDSRFILTIAIILFAISSFHTSIFNVEIDFERIALSRIAAGFGLALFLPPIFTLAFRGVPEEKGVDVVIIFQFIRAVSSGVGGGLFVILWQRRKVFYHERLGEGLNPYSQQTNLFFKQAAAYGSPEQSNGLLEYFLDRQATALALDDCFYLMGWMLVFLLVLLLATHFLRPIDLKKKI